jgi:hypothetical protein
MKHILWEKSFNIWSYTNSSISIRLNLIEPLVDTDARHLFARHVSKDVAQKDVAHQCQLVAKDLIALNDHHSVGFAIW